MDSSQEVMDASWEPADMPPIGGIVHFYTVERRQQWAGVGKGPYAAIVTKHGDGEGKLNLYVLPSTAIQMPTFYEDVAPHMTGVRWWQKPKGMP